MEKFRTNVYLEKEAFKKFKIKCIEEDKSVSEKINEFIINTTKDEKKSK